VGFGHVSGRLVHPFFGSYFMSSPFPLKLLLILVIGEFRHLLVLSQVRLEL
jgi:hypothetical protein